MRQNVGIIGTGEVGKTLAAGFLRHGHCVMIGSRDPNRLEQLQAEIGEPLETGSFAEAAVFGEIVVLAIKGTAARQVVEMIGPSRLAEKIVIDTTNPIADTPPIQGVVQFFTGPNESLMQALQGLAPQARFVKAWNSVGHPHMVNPSFRDGRPTMFICGDDEAARRVVRDVLHEFGWDTEDLGSAQAACAIESLCQLWCIPGFRENRWDHAFKLLRGG